MSIKITPIKFLRSLVYNKRPDPSKLLGGQPAVNTNSDQPGLFFRGTDDELIKIGPCAVGEVEPNSSTDPNGSGGGTNSKGEMWLDQTASPGPTLKVYDGTEWVNSYPLTYARVLVSASTPDADALNLPQGTLWWNSDNGLMYILFGDDPQGIWVQIGASSVA